MFFEGKAGPYSTLVTIRPPTVIPGIAEVEVRVPTGTVREVKVVPMPLTGPAAKLPPTPDIAKQSKQDPRSYTATVWLMATGSYQVRVQVEGAQGSGTVSIPVPAVARETKTMQAGLGIVLFFLMLLLVAGMIGIFGAAIGEARLSPGDKPSDRARKGGRIAMILTGVIVVAILILGAKWWTADANDYGTHVYKPLHMDASVAGGKLTLRLSDPGWLPLRRLDDFVPDHGHLMHLFVIRMPDMDRMWHLHPEQVENGVFEMDTPSLPAGQYWMYADVVHGTNGFAETAVADAPLPEIAGKELAGDDVAVEAPPLSSGFSERTIVPLSDGFHMVWVRPAGPLRAKQANRFVFRVEDTEGKPATDLEPYMGMAGHAEFVSIDGTVFAHVHPSGSISMQAFGMANGDSMAGMVHTATVPPEVSFPFGFPKQGRYRIFVQVKRAGRPVTGVFDAAAE